MQAFLWFLSIMSLSAGGCASSLCTQVFSLVGCVTAPWPHCWLYGAVTLCWCIKLSRLLLLFQALCWLFPAMHTPTGMLGSHTCWLLLHFSLFPLTSSVSAFTSGWLCTAKNNKNDIALSVKEMCFVVPLTGLLLGAEERQAVGALPGSAFPWLLLCVEMVHRFGFLQGICSFVRIHCW